VFWHLVDDLIGDAQVLDAVAANKTFGHLPELVSILVRARHIPDGNVHEHVATDQLAVIRVSILQFDQNVLALGALQQCEWKH